MGDGEGQGSLACFSPWCHKELDLTEQLYNNSNKYTVKHESGFSAGSENYAGDFKQKKKSLCNYEECRYGSCLGCQYSLSEFQKTDLPRELLSVLQRLGIYLLKFFCL